VKRLLLVAADIYLCPDLFTLGMAHLLVFDFDGVLVDSLHVFMPAFLEACRRERVPLKDEADFFRLLEDNLYLGMMNRGMSRSTILRIVLQVKEAIMSSWGRLQVFPGMAEVVRSLSAIHSLVVVTSNETETVETFLADRDLPWFDRVIGSDREPVKATILAGLRQEFPGLSCFYIGDTIGDIREGRQAGVKTVGVTWGWHGPRVGQAQPDHLVHRPAELAALFAPQPWTEKKDKHL
ncbi:MAG: HAD family hydrolase, partial [Thermoplasmatota archaeon]